MLDNPTSNTLKELQPYQYPLWIKTFVLSCLTSFLIAVPCFIVYELPIHFQLKQISDEVEKLLLEKQYEESMKINMEIIVKYPKYVNPKLQIARAAFSLINPNDEDDPYFPFGIYVIKDIDLKQADIEILTACLPSNNYKNKFNNSLSWKK